LASFATSVNVTAPSTLPGAMLSVRPSPNCTTVAAPTLAALTTVAHADQLTVAGGFSGL